MCQHTSNTVCRVWVEWFVSFKEGEYEVKMRMTSLFPPLALVLITASSWTAGYAQEHKAINLSSAKGLPFSDGIIAGNTLYIAGQEGSDESGKLASGGVGAETKAALDNIEKVLKAAGFELKDVVSVTVYLADIHDFAEMNKVYKTVLPDPKPARATIQAAGLVNDARVEIAAIAVKR